MATRIPKPSTSPVAPAEAEARADLARAALAERAAELAPDAGGESPGSEPGAVVTPLRDPAQDAAALAAVLECAIAGGARIVALRFPSSALFVAGTVLPKAQGFAAHAGAQLGPAVGMKFPRALTTAGGICSMLVWWLRTLPAPKPSTATEAPPPKPDAEPRPPPEDAFARAPGAR